MAANPKNLVWIDLEMTGLDADQCSILEIATLVTNQELEIVAEGPDLVIQSTPEQLETLSEWSRKTFAASGLLERSRASKVTLAAAEKKTLTFLKRHVPKGASPLCGNSVHTDRSFLWRHMRKLHDFLHYRNVDVSSWKEMIRRWFPDRFAPPVKAGSHVALADVRESVAELRYYRSTFLHPQAPPAADEPTSRARGPR